MDSLRTQGMHAAEKRCRRIYTGQKPYSPTLSNAAKRLLLWSKIKQRLKGRKINHKTMKKLMEITGICIDISDLTIEQAQKSQTQAIKEYKVISRQATALRATWLSQLAQARSEMQGVNYEQELLHMIGKEKTRAIHHRIRASLYNTRGNPLT